MSKYKAGDKIVLEITGVSRYGESYEIAHTSMWNKARLDRVAKPLSEYTEPLEVDASRLVKENVRLLAENAELKEKLHEEHHELVWQDGYSQGVSNEAEKWNENVKIIRDNAFEAGLIRGHEDAWKLAHKIFKMDVSTIEEIFIETGAWNLGSVLEDCTYSEAAAKVAEWERQKEEICVGDVVRFKENHRVEFCVTDIYDDRLLHGINAEGEVYADRDIELFEKTGRHIDVAAMLWQIGGGNDEK